MEYTIEDFYEGMEQAIKDGDICPKHPHLQEGDFVKNIYGDGVIEVVKSGGKLCLKGYKPLEDVSLKLVKVSI